MTGRDRDDGGRARNARPRDAAGRPLPRDAAGVERVDEDGVLPPGEALDEAQRLLDAGYPFHAHEVLEASWKAAPPDERPLWQGLAQLAVGLTHEQRGNARGAASLLRRGAGNVVEAGAEVGQRHGVDVDAIDAWATARADGNDLGRPADTASPRLRAR